MATSFAAPAEPGRIPTIAHGMIPALSVLVLALCGTALAWYITNAATQSEARQRFDTEVRAIQLDLEERLRTYEQVLRGGVSVFHTWPTVTREHWRAYVEHLHIADNYPGIQGIGFAQVIRPADRQAHILGVRAEGFPDYRIWPQGARETYTAIVYLEPFDWRNRRAFGYDMFQDPVRRAAMERARDTGIPSLSGKVTLVQETDEAVQPGFLMYLPVYRTPSPLDVSQRRRQLLGYVYSPFRMRDFMHGLLGGRDRRIALQVFDGEVPDREALMYASAAWNETLQADAPFVTTVPLSLDSHVWTLRFTAMPAMRADQAKPRIVAVGGLVTSFLLWVIALTLARNRAQAAAANERLRFDIARREQIEAQLRDTEASFRYLFEKNPNPMWVFDRETLSILEVNDAAVDHYGYSHEEFRRLRITELRPAEDVPRLESFLQDRHPGLSESGEWRHITKDGRTIDVEIVGYTLEFRHRAATLVVARDITHSKLAEQALRESEAAVRGVLDAALDAYVRMDQEGRITEWNPVAERIFGWSRGEVIGCPLEEILIPPGQRASHRRGLAHFLATGEGPILNQRFELQGLHRDGRKLPLELAILAVKTGRKHAFSAFLRDLTEKKQAESRLLQSQKMEAIGQLTGGIAHDFNNILTVVLGNADLLTEALADNKRLGPLAELINEGAQRGAELTHRLLAFARQQPLDPTIVDLNVLVRGMQGLLRRTLGEHVEIQLECSQELWPALVDGPQLESALLNLAINARDAMPHGGKLVIETRNVELDEDYTSHHTNVQPGEYVLLAVSDSGCGIAPEALERVLEPFYTTKEKGKGTGLGLAMVYGFAKQSSGHLKIYSELGMGTTVNLYLPRPEEDSEPASRPSGEPDATGGSETILLVEDDALVRSYAEGQLAALGYEVVSAGNGPEAMEIIRRHEDIDLLFTDVIMPGGMNGRELADAARAIRPGLRVLFTSGYAENAIVHHGRLDPGVTLLVKPYRRSQLATKIREALAGNTPGS